jgi:hypothetical protein
VLVYLGLAGRFSEDLSGVVVRGHRDANRRITTMETQKPDVAIVTAIGPDQEEGIEKPFYEAAAGRPAHQASFTFGTLIDSLGKQKLHKRFR